MSAIKDCTTLDEAFLKLTRALGKSTEIFEAEFFDLAPERNESVHFFATRLQELCSNAYPGLPKDAKDRMCQRQLLLYVGESEKLYGPIANSFDDLVNLISARRPTFQENFDEVNIKTSKAAQKERNPKRLQNKAKDVVCYNCREVGHFKYQCKKKPSQQTKQNETKINAAQLNQMNDNEPHLNSIQISNN
mgnify:CR=1 FL=1